MTDGSPYGKVLGRNISAARGRVQLRQGDVAARMRALGFAWQQQTAAAVERGNRRPTGEELLGLSLALETTIPALTGTRDHPGFVQLPNGASIGAISVERLAGRGVNDRSVQWPDGGNVPAIFALIAAPGEETFDRELLGPQEPPS